MELRIILLKCLFVSVAVSESNGQRSTKGLESYQIDFETGSGEENSPTLLRNIGEDMMIPVSHPPADILTISDNHTNTQSTRQEQSGVIDKIRDKIRAETLAVTTEAAHGLSSADSAIIHFHQSDFLSDDHVKLFEADEKRFSSYTEYGHLDTEYGHLDTVEGMSTEGVRPRTGPEEPGARMAEGEGRKTALRLETAAAAAAAAAAVNPELTESSDAIDRSTLASDQVGTDAPHRQSNQLNTVNETSTEGGGGGGEEEEEEEEETSLEIVKPIAAPDKEYRLNYANENCFDCAVNETTLRPNHNNKTTSLTLIRATALDPNENFDAEKQKGGDILEQSSVYESSSESEFSSTAFKSFIEGSKSNKSISTDKVQTNRKEHSNETQELGSQVLNESLTAAHDAHVNTFAPLTHANIPAHSSKPRVTSELSESKLQSSEADNRIDSKDEILLILGSTKSIITNEQRITTAPKIKGYNITGKTTTSRENYFLGSETNRFHTVITGHFTVSRERENTQKSKFPNKSRTTKCHLTDLQSITLIDSVQTATPASEAEPRATANAEPRATANAEPRATANAEPRATANFLNALNRTDVKSYTGKSSTSNIRSVLLNLDGHLIGIRLSLKIQSVIMQLEEIQTVRKLRLLLEHQINAAFLECPGFVHSEITTFKSGSILAEGNLFFSASFLFFAEDAIVKIKNYVKNYAIPLMTSSTPFGRIDPSWSNSFTEELSVLNEELKWSPCQRLGSICGPCARCRHNKDVIWCQNDCDVDAHQTCIATDLHSMSTQHKCTCEELYANIGGACVVFWVLLLPLVVLSCISLAAVASLIFCLVKRKRQQRNAIFPPFSRNRVDRLLSSRASIWMNPRKNENGGSGRKKLKRNHTPGDLHSPWGDSFAVTSSPPVVIATDPTSQETFVTFGKRHKSNNNDRDSENDDVIHKDIVNDVMIEPIKSVRGRQSEENILKDQFLISLLLKNAKQESTSEGGSSSNSFYKDSSNSSSSVEPIGSRRQPESASFYI